MQEYSKNTSSSQGNEQEQGQSQGQNPIQQKTSDQKTWDGPVAEQTRIDTDQQLGINQHESPSSDPGNYSDSPPLRNELDPPKAPDIQPDKSPDEINFPGKHEVPTVPQPQSASDDEDKDDAKTEDDVDKEDKSQQIEEEAITKSEANNLTDQRGYNEIRENSPVNNEREKEFLN